MKAMSGEDLLLGILRGGTLADKMLGAGVRFSELTWRETGFSPEELPGLPGREGFPLPEAEGSVRFPKKNELRKSMQARGRLLHFFANHELLAIETMALVLLRFPEAPVAFREGLFRTLQDEQRHLQAYLGRMQEYGVPFGSVPLSLYFWNALKSIGSPLEFVAGMSLTFEQANLDFAAEHAEFFERELSDDQTARLLREVHDDEVKHVAHGWKWFQKWRSEEAGGEFEAYRKALVFPLTPRRARGSAVFAASSREAAGLSSDFIRNIRIAGGSRGRRPTLHRFNPGCELESSGVSFSRRARQKISDFESLLAWVAQEEDVIMGAAPRDLAFLEGVYRMRGFLPEWIPDDPGLSRFQMFQRFRPWGHTPSTFEWLGGLSIPFEESPRFEPDRLFRDWYHKGYWKHRLGTEGWWISEPEDLQRFYDERDPDVGTYLIKDGFGMSGRGHQILPLTGEVPRELKVQLESRLRFNGGFVIEPFFDKILDFSVQYELHDDGTLDEGDPRIFFTDTDGFSYRGSRLGEAETGPLLASEASWRPVHRRVADELRSAGYAGSFGIDCMWVRERNGEPRVVPVVEVNVRMTMGRVAREIEEALRRQRGRAEGYWIFFGEQDLVRQGVSGFPELACALSREFGDRFLPTTSPELARSTWTFVILEDGDGADIRRRFLS